MTNQIQVYMKKPEIIKKFGEIVGDWNAQAYVTGVLIVVNNSEALQKCTPESVLGAAIQAATLRLSCDPTIGEAYIIPRKGRATFQIGWRGYYRMALRTNKYRYINDTRIFVGETIVEDRLTGLHSIEGHKTGKEWTGWLLAFELRSGYQKTFYMSREELKAHGEKYGSSNDSKNPMWLTNFEAMCRKTVYRLGLSRYGVFDPYDQQFIAQDVDTYDAPPMIVETTEEAPRKSEAQLMNELGFDGGDVVTGEWTPEEQPEEPPATETKPEPAYTIDDAELEFSNSEKKHYGELMNDKLTLMHASLLKVTNKTDEQTRKQKAIEMIIAARRQGRRVARFSDEAQQ